MATWRAWLQAVRPRVFTATYVPMGLAGIAAYDDGVFAAHPFLLALLGTLLLQSAANLINEYADFRRGADAFKLAGQGMTIKRQILSPQTVLAGAVLTTLGGCCIGLLLLAQSGPLLWLIGIGGVLVAVSYTAGPFPLAYNGLGEIAVAIFMGPAIVVGAYYVMFPDVSEARIGELCLASLPVACMVAAILHANNIRDMDADRAVGKRTLAVIFGIRFARFEYMFLALGAYISQAALVAFGLLPAATLLTLMTLPQALRLIQVIYTSGDVALLHKAQGLTAKLHGQVGLLLTLGWALSLL
ncbi:MAG: 1,4-dihydroxy-2-naphthoate octaprenyltransferase [Chloroflexi bacterium]|nr:1,4-dihydroxy-2-naphthoate octaprenyltransferase [Chloroflexota bacterium]MCY4246452.1 1,4-dihydroxy-2-naphthoate octaprenyltransferase [Chloroflexota bacterium]